MAESPGEHSKHYSLRPGDTDRAISPTLRGGLLRWCPLKNLKNPRRNKTEEEDSVQFPTRGNACGGGFSAIFAAVEEEERTKRTKRQLHRAPRPRSWGALTACFERAIWPPTNQTISFEDRAEGRACLRLERNSKGEDGSDRANQGHQARTARTHSTYTEEAFHEANQGAPGMY